jgi:hypothetical protein
MKVVISSGHGKYVRGASGSPVPPELDEVDEARRVVERVAEYLRSAGVGVVTFHDNTSRDQNTNLNTIVNYHNKQTRDLDVSVHFNATEGAHGTEVLYVTQESLAAKVSTSICAAGGFTNRGAKYHGDLFFLNKTKEPAILIETCFCDSTSDSNLYHAHFDAICLAIAESIGGVPVGELPPDRPPEQPPIAEPPPTTAHETLAKGSTGPEVELVQTILGLPADGDFGSITDAGVRGYQGACGLAKDGIVGPQTWSALDQLEAKILAGEDGISKRLDDRIDISVKSSPLLNYDWNDRGCMPIGYYLGMAKTFALAVKMYDSGDEMALQMAEADTGDDEHDALSWYSDVFSDHGMDNSENGLDTLRHLFVLLIGLGARESSGNHWCGRDMSADNTSSETAEAGAWQTSWNISSCSPQIDELMAQYWRDPNGFRSSFSNGVSPSASNLDNYGSGEGSRYQFLAKYTPAFAAFVTALGMRYLRAHWGPLNRREVEVVDMADDLLIDVQRLVEVDSEIA